MIEYKFIGRSGIQYTMTITDKREDKTLGRPDKDKKHKGEVLNPQGAVMHTIEMDTDFAQVLQEMSEAIRALR